MNAGKFLITFWFASSVLVLPGCALFDGTNSGASSSPDAQLEDNYVQDQIKRLNERVTGLETSDANLQRELADIKTTLAQIQGSSTGQASAADLQQLRVQVQALETQREKDKQIILDQVAKELSGLASTKRSKSSESTGGSPNDVGYEHVVKQGQTLTDVAKIYGVTVAAIKKANNLTSTTLRVGQKLFIPKTQ